jgi:arylsulfatase I/J
MDGKVGEVVDVLNQRGMYDNTLIFFASDNGGPIYNDGSAGANNYPLRGGKASNFEGGVRVNAFLSGGAVPTAMRGKKLEGLGTVWGKYLFCFRLFNLVCFPMHL